MGHNRYPHRPLPSNASPTGTRCITLTIPDDDEWERDIYSQAAELTKWYMWERDIGHNGKPIADIWRAALETWNRCIENMFDVRQNDEMPCVLEKTIDGETWEAWANLQLCPPKIRINRGKAQWFNTATGLWENVPDSGDEREDGTFDPPYPGGVVPVGQSAQCLSAENILSVYSTVFAQMRADVVAEKFISAITAGALALLSVWLEPAIIAADVFLLATGALALAEVGLNDMLSSDTLELLRCNLYCNAAPDGSFTALGYSAFYEGLDTDFDSLKLTVLQYYFDCLGPVGLSRQGKANAIEVADCSSCGDCDDITATYNFGSYGPTRIQTGFHYTLHAAARGGQYTLDVLFSVDVNVEILLSSFVQPTNDYKSMAYTTAALFPTTFSYVNTGDPSGEYDGYVYFSINSHNPFTADMLFS